jgi:hypothetical protein
MAAVIDDDTAQKIGVCSILYNSGEYKLKPGIIGRTTESARRNGYMTTCLPCRYTSLRLCYAFTDPITDLFTNSLRLAVGKSTRLRLGVHLGEFCVCVESILHCMQFVYIFWQTRLI